MQLTKRTKILVDRTFQLQYLKIFLLIGLGIAGATVSVVLIPQYLKGAGDIDPEVVKMLTGLCIFIVLLCTLMGILSVALTHRVAGATLRLNRFVYGIIYGGSDMEVHLRKGDYMHSLADALNVLALHLRTCRHEITEIAGRLEAIKGELQQSGALSDPQRTALDDAIARLRTPPRPPDLKPIP